MKLFRYPSFFQRARARCGVESNRCRRQPATTPGRVRKFAIAVSRSPGAVPHRSRAVTSENASVIRFPGGGREFPSGVRKFPSAVRNLPRRVRKLPAASGTFPHAFNRPHFPSAAFHRSSHTWSDVYDEYSTGNLPPQELFPANSLFSRQIESEQTVCTGN